MIDDTRHNFKAMKVEQRHKMVVKFLATNRELYHSLLDANLSIDKVNAPLTQPENRFDPHDVSHLIEMNHHQRKVYNIVKEYYRKKQLLDDYLLIDTEEEPAHITKLRTESPASF